MTRDPYDLPKTYPLEEEPWGQEDSTWGADYSDPENSLGLSSEGNQEPAYPSRQTYRQGQVGPEGESDQAGEDWDQEDDYDYHVGLDRFLNRGIILLTVLIILVLIIAFIV